MRRCSPRWVATATSALLVLGGFAQPAAAQTADTPPPVATVPPCSFKLGFATLVQMSPVKDVVGTCLENEYFNVLNGNAEQRTTRGLLYWRKTDNVTAFTDGNITWLNGPVGIQARLNTAPPFEWEVVGLMAPAPLTANTPVTEAPIIVADAPAPQVAPAVVPPPVTPAAPTVTAPPITSGPLNLRGADLTNADRRGADLTNADLYQAKLAGADFTNAKLTGASLIEADISRAVFFQADLTNVQGMAITGGGSRNSPGPNFGQAHLNNAKFTQAKLSGGDFRQADLRGADLSRASLAGADLRGADLRGADLTLADFSGANLTGANLTGADTTGASFKGAITGGCTGCP